MTRRVAASQAEKAIGIDALRALQPGRNRFSMSVDMKGAKKRRYRSASGNALSF